MLTFPRILGVLVLIWGLRAIPEAILTRQPFWAGTALLWLSAGAYLVMLRRVRLASLVVLALSVVEMVVREPQLTGLELLAWICLIVAVTEDRPADRALLLRTCASVVYAFAALTKLNPSWLAGDGISGLILRQSQLAAVLPLAQSELFTTTAALTVIALEAWLAIGLWWSRTRVATAAIGVCTHLAFIVAASPNLWAAVHLTLLNFGLVACYIAFWSDISSRSDSAVLESPIPT